MLLTKPVTFLTGLLAGGLAMGKVRPGRSGCRSRHIPRLICTMGCRRTLARGPSQESARKRPKYSADLPRMGWKLNGAMRLRQGQAGSSRQLAATDRGV